MFDILVTIMGTLDEKAAALDLVRDLENQVARLQRLGIAIEVRDSHLRAPVYRRILVPAGEGDGM